MKYGNRSIAKRIIASPIAMVVGLVLLIVLIKAGWNIYSKAELSSERLSQAQTELSKLQARQIELSTRVGMLSTEQGLDTEIRTKYHAVKEGESVAVIVDENKAGVAAAASASMTQATTSISWWRKMLQIFGF